MKTIYFLFAINLIINIAYSQTILKCFTAGNPHTLAEYNEVGYYFNNNPVEYSGCQAIPSIIIAVIDNNCNAWDNCLHNFGQANQCSTGVGSCRNRPEKFFIFYLNNQAQVDSMKYMLTVIPSGHYLLAYTWFTYQYSSLPNFKTAFQNLGATQIVSLPDNVPYIFFTQMGNPNSILEGLGNSSSDSISITTLLNCTFNSVAEKENEIPFNIYVSQSENNLTVYGIKSGSSWSVIDLNGKKILTGIYSNEKISLHKLSKGQYIFAVDDMNTKFRKVFVLY